jgi:Flp pilus assembly protein TadG
MATLTRVRRAGRRFSPAASGTAGRLRARWRRVAARPDAGGATAELVVAMPLLLLMVMFIVQAGVWMHATHVAQAAATRAANTAAAYNSSAAAGQNAGTQTVTALGGGVLIDPRVSVTRTATEVRVEVDGTAETVVPGIHWAARAVVVRPVERFVPDTGGFTNSEALLGGN